MIVSELARPFPVALPAIMKHLDVLSAAGLVERTRIGRPVTCRRKAEPMKQALDLLARYGRYWTDRLDRLARLLEAEDRGAPRRSAVRRRR